MNLRVEIDSICVSVDLEDSSWTPELIETVLRQCGDEAIRVVGAIGFPSHQAMMEMLAEDDSDDSDSSEAGE